ncbi:MAG TPA: AI-2E family transporter, partial [candidate division WWE3 bacterium]|nr:AI-2E family transporter [candidate division WWE3 bacterium]
IGLVALGVNYALSLALIAGILEIVPIIGPIIATIPALIVGFAVSPIKGLGVLGLYILIQQLENNLIVPKVMQKAVGFNPLITMTAILIGGSLFGVLGALLSIPVTIIIVILFKHLYRKRY